MVRSAIFLICVFGLALGCAHSHDKFYYKDGTICAEAKSTVFGTGEAEKFVTDTKCFTLSYSTKDTGISDNATKLGGKVAEGLAKGAVEGLTPVP
jgi:hypothetical protein